jgi:hypothetical protein
VRGVVRQTITYVSYHLARPPGLMSNFDHRLKKIQEKKKVIKEKAALERKARGEAGKF